MKVLGLFSGIGGFELGLERAGFKIAAMCEIDPFCRKVLKKHWPETPLYRDVIKLSSRRLIEDGITPEVICGGFPCQDISHANSCSQRLGIEGARSGLWKEYARLIGEVRPRYAIMENVSALLSNGLSTVLGDLASIGYDATWHCIPASAVNAPHRRDRIWIVAYPSSGRAAEKSTSTIAQFIERHAEMGLESQRGCLRRSDNTSSDVAWNSSTWGDNGGRNAKPILVRVANGVPDRLDRSQSLGNAVVPQIPELIGRAIIQCEIECSARVLKPSGEEDRNMSLRILDR